MKGTYLSVMFVTLAAALEAQPAPAPPHPPAVRASADASVFVKPDQAKIAIGVVSEAPSAASAAQQNAAQVQTVLDKLRATLGPKANIRTISYSVNPNYQYPKPGAKPTIEGYTAVNTVEVTIDDLASVGKAIDAATASGANRIQWLQFTLKDEAQARAEALKKASAEARANAEAMASALGLRLGKIIAVDQGGSPVPVRPMMMAAENARAAAPTPIEADAIEVRASVVLTIAIE